MKPKSDEKKSEKVPAISVSPSDVITASTGVRPMDNHESLHDQAKGLPRHFKPMASVKPKMLKQLVRMNSDSDLHIQPISSEEERVLETLDEIALLHTIAEKKPDIRDNKDKVMLLNQGPIKPPAPGVVGHGRGGGKRLLVKQKSLNRTLSTSVLRIKQKKSTFWNT